MAFIEKHETGQKNLKIVKFDKRKGYYLYIYDSETKKVSYSAIGSEDLQYCKESWFATYQKYVEKGGSTIKVQRALIKKKLKEFVDVEYARFTRGEIKERSFNTIYERVRNRIIPYIEQHKVQSVQDIRKKSFDDFCAYWRELGKEIATIKSALNTFNRFFSWMVEEDILDANNKPNIKKLRNTKDYKTEANPAFTGEDWAKFKDTLHRYEILDESWTDDVDEKERWWYRRAFTSWVFFQFHLGCRNHESLKLTYGDVKVEKKKLPNGADSLMGVIDIPADTKRGRRTSIMNGWYVTRVTQHLNAFQHPIWLKTEITDETPLFLNPRTGNAIHQETFRGHFKNVIRLAGLEGKGYTLYSLRSTHITFQLLNGISVEDVARNLGTSYQMINLHYDGVANVLKSDELLKLNRHYFQDSNY